jgi:uncharacterized protein (DUF1499 family)
MARVMGLAAVVLVALVAGLVLYVRLAPLEAADWHVDPMTAPVPTTNGWLLRQGDGNAPASVYATDPAAVLAALDAVAMATPRTERVAGSVEDGRITWMTRSRLVGFPDLTTAAAVAGPEGTRLVILARQRFGGGDWGVNRARIEAWVSALDLPRR